MPRWSLHSLNAPFTRPSSVLPASWGGGGGRQTCHRGSGGDGGGRGLSTCGQGRCARAGAWPCRHLGHGLWPLLQPFLRRHAAVRWTSRVCACAVPRMAPLRPATHLYSCCVHVRRHMPAVLEQRKAQHGQHRAWVAQHQPAHITREMQHAGRLCLGSALQTDSQERVQAADCWLWLWQCQQLSISSCCV